MTCQHPFIRSFFLALTILIWGCESKHAHTDNARQGFGETRADRLLGSSHSAWVTSWEKVAVDHNLPPEVIDEITNIIKDALSCPDEANQYHSLSPDNMQAYERSLHNFINTQFPEFFYTLPSYRASGYWLAYCITQANSRCIQGDCFEDPNKPYKRFAEAVSSIIQKEYIRQLGDDYKRWLGEIESGIEDFQKAMDTSVATLQADILFPGFRGEPIDIAALQYIVEWVFFGDRPMLPKYEEPLEMLVSKDERFKRSLSTFFSEQLVNECLVDMFQQGLYATFDQPCWATVEWRARGRRTLDSSASKLYWPSRVGVVMHVRERQFAD